MLRASISRGTRSGGGTPARPDERGMTLIEILVATTVMMTIALGLVATIPVFSKSEVTTVNSANSASSTRMVLLQLQHDIQSASSVTAQSNAASYDDELQLTIQPSGSVVTWVYSPSSQAAQLTRQVGSSSAQVELTKVSNGDPTANPPGEPVFQYFDACSNDLVAQEQLLPSQNQNFGSIAPATTVIQVRLSVENVDSAPYGSTTSVNIMNRSPGGTQCL
jgi:Tfp pilus assembly protein PilV